MTLEMADYLRAVETHRGEAYEALVDAGHHPNVVYAKAEKAARKGYTEYGVAPHRGWLTDEGRAFLHGTPGEQLLAQYQRTFGDAYRQVQEAMLAHEDDG